MDDTEFTGLLKQAGTTTTVRATTLDRLVEDAGARSARRSRRMPLIVGTAVVAAVLLAAAASTSYWTKLPPFQSLEDDMYRTSTAIPVDFTTTSEVRVGCDAFLEFKGLSVRQSERAEAYVAGRDWSGLGQRLYDENAPAHESYEHAQTRIFSALDPVMLQAAAAAVPTALPQGTDTNAARINGWSIDCRRAAK